jgi:multiple sugar transport system substrate-binding protein
MPEASKALGAEVVLETINANDLQPRITAAIQSGAGPDIFLFQDNWAQLYANAVVDVSDVASELAKAEGGFYDVFEPAAHVGGKWQAVPHSILGNAVSYRKSWLKEAGKGKPYGQTLGHTFGDAPTFTYTLLWAFGGAETDKTGKKVVINSKGAGSPGTTPTTTGPMWTDIDHAPLPAGPAGAYLLFLNHQDAIMRYSKNQKLAKDLLRWIHKPENYGKWFTSQEGYSVGATKKWENDPMWGKLDEPLKMFRTAARNTRVFGYAGPSTAKATEAFSKYIVTDMYVKGVQGMRAEDAVHWAEGELKKIYEA